MKYPVLCIIRFAIISEGSAQFKVELKKEDRIIIISEGDRVRYSLQSHNG
jgi:hypothetical protein